MSDQFRPDNIVSATLAPVTNGYVSRRFRPPVGTHQCVSQRSHGRKVFAARCTHESQVGNHGQRFYWTTPSQMICLRTEWSGQHLGQKSLPRAKLIDSLLDVVRKTEFRPDEQIGTGNSWTKGHCTEDAEFIDFVLDGEEGRAGLRLPPRFRIMETFHHPVAEAPTRWWSRPTPSWASSSSTSACFWTTKPCTTGTPPTEI